MKLSYRIPVTETPPRLEINRDERGLTITVGGPKRFTNPARMFGYYVAGIVIVLIVNGGVTIAMMQAMSGGRRSEALCWLFVTSLIWLTVAALILVLHDGSNRYTIFNVRADGLRVATHGPIGVRRYFVRRERIISIECRKDVGGADDRHVSHYLAVTSRHTRSYNGSRAWLDRYPEELINKVAQELGQALSLPR